MFPRRAWSCHDWRRVSPVGRFQRRCVAAPRPNGGESRGFAGGKQSLGSTLHAALLKRSASENRGGCDARATLLARVPLFPWRHRLCSGSAFRGSRCVFDGTDRLFGERQFRLKSATSESTPNDKNIK